MKRGIGILTGLLCLVLVSCTPAQLAGARRGATDFALCETEIALLPSLSGLGAQLDKEDWKAWGTNALRGALSGAAVCGLRSLATALRADGPALTQTDGARIQALADRCAAGPCSTAEERAAWLLWQEIRAGRLRIPPSGEG